MDLAARNVGSIQIQPWNHRRVWVGSDLWRSSAPTPLHPEHLTQEHIQVSLGNSNKNHVESKQQNLISTERGEIVAVTKFCWRGWVKTDFNLYFVQLFALETLPSLQMGWASLPKTPGRRQSVQLSWETKWMNFDFEAVGGKAEELLSGTCSSNPLHTHWLCLNHPHLQFSTQG